MDDLNLDFIAVRNFAIAILIGALVGIEREKRRDTEQTISEVADFPRHMQPIKPPARYRTLAVECTGNLAAYRRCGIGILAEIDGS